MTRLRWITWLINKSVIWYVKCMWLCVYICYIINIFMHINTVIHTYCLNLKKHTHVFVCQSFGISPRPFLFFLFFWSHPPRVDVPGPGIKTPLQKRSKLLQWCQVHKLLCYKGTPMAFSLVVGWLIGILVVLLPESTTTSQFPFL